uniref:RIIa domain-containing protein 1 n=2 Tax=Callorhinchus milii TaxID=7868 RepID=V9LIR9_CALMI|eukprot:gi/632990570/ref/XP_007884226.1/ PREDICTED: RIIa domain-containing protein 1 [Callorhinchus milii]
MAKRSAAAAPPPVGVEAYDSEALDAEQQRNLWQYKIQTRLANEYYLRSHPEIDLLLMGFLRSLLLRRPGNIREFAAKHFTDPQLPTRITEKLHEQQKESRRKVTLH